MADAVSQPHVVVTFIPNQWSMNHFDIHVDNTGNATAYDIEIVYPPSLKRERGSNTDSLPFRKISILKPNQKLTCSFATYEYLYDFSSIEILIKWKRHPTDTKQEYNKYILSMNDYEVFGRLGDTPEITISNSIKQISETLKNINLKLKQ